MAPGSAAFLFVLSVAASAASAAAAVTAACSNVSGFYGVVGGQGSEVIISQPVGCNFTATDLEGGNISGWVAGVNMTVNFYNPGEPVQTLMGIYDPIAMSFNISVGNQSQVLRRINCTRAFSGFWSNGVNIMAISENQLTCTGTMFSIPIGSTPIVLPAMAIALNVSGLTATFAVSGSVRTALFRFPDTIIIGGEPPYKMAGTYPCFKASDFNLSPQCFSDLLLLGQNGTFAALNASFARRNYTFAAVHLAYCAGQSTWQTCQAPCAWLVDEGYGWCNCPDEASCLASGLGWVSRPYPCDSSLSAMMMMATSDCCSGGPNFCQAIGTDPMWGQPPPSPGPAPGPGCVKLPMSAIQSFEATTKMVVRRCGSTPSPPPYYMPSPAPYYMPSPTPYYMPQPSPSGVPPYMPPSPVYMPPSPSYMAPSPSLKR